jgi:transposase-like protein
MPASGKPMHFYSGVDARIIEEILVPDAVVSDVARRHGLSPRQSFTWRWETRYRSVTPAPEVGLRRALTEHAVRETDLRRLTSIGIERVGRGGANQGCDRPLACSTRLRPFALAR